MLNFAVILHRVHIETRRSLDGDAYQRERNVKCGEITFPAMNKALEFADNFMQHMSLSDDHSLHAKAVAIHYKQGGGRVLLTMEEMERIAETFEKVSDTFKRN